MERIWICDDQKEAIKELSRILKPLTPRKIVEFTDVESLLAYGKTHSGEAGIIFLDIDFQGKTIGFQVANEILAENPDVSIIFMTAYSNKFAQEVLLECSGASGYVLKPFNATIIQRYMEKIEQIRSNRKRLKIRKKGQEIAIDEKNIIYLESNDHKVIVHTVDGEILVYEKLSSLEARLSQEFLSCHKSYLINLNHVTKNEYESFTLTDGTVVPISRPNRKKSKELFFEHLRKKASQEI